MPAFQTVRDRLLSLQSRHDSILNGPQRTTRSGHGCCRIARLKAAAQPSDGQSVELDLEPPRPADVDAHHIVALTHWDALPARLHLFDIGLGINDGANGVFLPNNGTGLPGFPRAPYHRKDHSRSYHIAVFDELQFASNADEGRVALGELKDQILSGALPL